MEGGILEQPKTVLLVEDNPDDEKLMLRALRMSETPMNVIVARDGAEAEAYLFGDPESGRQPGRPPSLILMDLKLPRRVGVEVLQRIRSSEETCKMPVVVLTSSDEERDIVDSYENGANSYIRKPVDFEVFVDTVRQIGLYWLVLNRRPDPLI